MAPPEPKKGKQEPIPEPPKRKIDASNFENMFTRMNGFGPVIIRKPQKEKASPFLFGGNSQNAPLVSQKSKMFQKP